MTAGAVRARLSAHTCACGEPRANPRRCAVAIAHAALIAASLAFATMAPALAAGLAAQIERGRALYFNESGVLDAAGARSSGAPLPGDSAACVACHRRSGLGSAEGTVLVPPIAGDWLFYPLSPQTGRRLPWPGRDRTRPAYDITSLAAALRDGHAPDGVRLNVPMPRYALADADVAALAAYLRTLSTERAPGVSDDEVMFATITTPDVPPAQVDDLLRTLNAFFADKNAGTRGETRRRAQALRNDDTMYRRYRRWRLEHWALTGSPESWPAQLAARYARSPVFAVISGISYDIWQPVHAFCESNQVPCLLPSAWMPPAREGFYSIYFSPGLDGEVRALGPRLAGQGVREVAAWTLPTPAGERQRAAIRNALAVAGVALVDRPPREGEVIVSALPADALRTRVAQGPGSFSRVYVLGGVLDALPDRWQSVLAGSVAEPVLVTDAAAPDAARRQLTRARAWVGAKRIAPSSERVVVNALLAATIAAESLMHVDERFSREYCIEKLEHTLENMPALTAYPRLAIGPGQRFATRSVLLIEGTDRGRTQEPMRKLAGAAAALPAQ